MPKRELVRPGSSSVRPMSRWQIRRSCRPAWPSDRHRSCRSPSGPVPRRAARLGFRTGRLIDRLRSDACGRLRRQLRGFLRAGRVRTAGKSKYRCKSKYQSKHGARKQVAFHSHDLVAPWRRWLSGDGRPELVTSDLRPIMAAAHRKKYTGCTLTLSLRLMVTSSALSTGFNARSCSGNPYFKRIIAGVPQKSGFSAFGVP